MIITPLLDQFIQQIGENFGKTQCIASGHLHLVPSIVHKAREINLVEAISYEEDLPNESDRDRNLAMAKQVERTYR